LSRQFRLITTATYQPDCRHTGPQTPTKHRISWIYSTPTEYLRTMRTSKQATTSPLINSPIIATISTTVMIRQPPPRLHTAHAHWETCKTIIRDNVDHAPKLKTSEDIEIATENLTTSSSSCYSNKNSSKNIHHFTPRHKAHGSYQV
jgi:hypothetical protein